MEIGFGPLVTLGLAAIAGVVWLVRLEGKQTKEAALRLASELRLEALVIKETALRGALEARIDGFEARIYRALERIESKLDAKEDREANHGRNRHGDR